jgi:hypothetical protein
MTPVILGDIAFGLFFLAVSLVMFWYWQRTTYRDKYLFLAFSLGSIAFLLNWFDLIVNVSQTSSELRLLSAKIVRWSLPLIAIISFGLLFYRTRKGNGRE